MGPYSELVYSGYILIPDFGPILRARDFDLRRARTQTHEVPQAPNKALNAGHILYHVVIKMVFRPAARFLLMAAIS